MWCVTYHCLTVEQEITIFLHQLLRMWICWARLQLCYSCVVLLLLSVVAFFKRCSICIKNRKETRTSFYFAFGVLVKNVYSSDYWLWDPIVAQDSKHNFPVNAVKCLRKVNECYMYRQLVVMEPSIIHLRVWICWAQFRPPRNPAWLFLSCGSVLSRILFRRILQYISLWTSMLFPCSWS